MKFSGASVAVAAILAIPANCIFNSQTDLGEYWGQNSYQAQQGQPLAQQNLSTYCANSNVDFLPMAFVTKITSGKNASTLAVNFANGGYSCGVFPNTELWDCPSYEQDLKTCQQTYGKKILLSIGGSMYNEGGFKNQAQAIASANLIWNTFGPVNSSSSLPRTFHGGVVDGFDLDIEQKNTYFRAFALQLRKLMNADTSKQWYLTAAPQCPYPDFMDPMFNDPNGGVPFDALFIQYYNNAACGLRTFNTASGATQSSFNFQTWNNWATTKSANKNVKLFLGVPGGPTAAQKEDYKTPAGLKPIINYCKTFSNFGGVTVWDASQAAATVKAGTPFLQNVKLILQGKMKKKSVKSRVMARQMIEEEAMEV